VLTGEGVGRAIDLAAFGVFAGLAEGEGDGAEAAADGTGDGVLVATATVRVERPCFGAFA